MDIVLMKQTSILSLILGLLLGVLVIIPYVSLFSFLALMFISAVIVIVYMKKNNIIGLLTPKDGAIIGALTGFVSCIGFCMITIPLAILLSWVNSVWFHQIGWYSGIKIWFENGVGGFLLLIMMIIFIALISALMNSFSGLATVYFYEQIHNKEETHETFHIDN